MSWGSRDQGPQTKDQKKQVCPPPVWRPEIQNQGVSRTAGKYLLCLFQLLVALAAPHLWPHPSSRCLSQLWAAPLSVSDKFLSSYKKPGTLHRGPRCSNTTSSLFVAARLYFQGRSPSHVPGGRVFWGHLSPFPDGSVGKKVPANAGEVSLIPESGRSPREGNGNPLQHSCKRNPMDRRAWWAAVQGVAENQTRFSD